MSNMEKAPSVFENGSTWVRADFHMHTEADKEFKYTPRSNSSFTSDYVAALKAANIRIAIIANHNKFDRDEFKVLARAARKEEIFLLPGLELSVKDGSNGIHMVVVFDQGWITNTENTNYIQSFLNVTFAGQANFENENGRSNHDLNETMRELDKFGRDYFLVCAHVESPNGLWGGLSGGRIAELSKSENFRERCLGFQKVKTNDKRVQVKGWLGDWYPAELEGCDCKSIEDIGKGKQVFLKVGAFTYEAVKFALLDNVSRIAAQPPKTEHSFLKKVAFEGDKLNGRTIDFSPELNTLIGIRGSGKSTILEALRYVLDIDFGKNAADRDYKEGAIKNALGSGGKITLTAVDRHRHEYEVRRIIGEQADVYVNNKLQPGISIRETVIHKPIYFGQKDLSNTGQGFENDLVEKLVGERLSEIRQAIAHQRQSVVELTRRLEKLSDVGEKEREYQAKIQDAEFRLKTYKAHGIEEKLQKQVNYEQDERTVKELMQFVAGYLLELDDFIARYADDFANRRKYTSKENAAFFEGVYDIFDRAGDGFKQIGKIANQTRTASADLKDKVKEFDGLKNTLKEQFAEVARKLSEELKSSG